MSRPLTSLSCANPIAKEIGGVLVDQGACLCTSLDDARPVLPVIGKTLGLLLRFKKPEPLDLVHFRSNLALERVGILESLRGSTYCEKRRCAQRGWRSANEGSKRVWLSDEAEGGRGLVRVFPALSLGETAMMQMGFVDRFPPDLSCFKNGQRLAFRPCENFQGPNGTDAHSRAHIGKQRQYQGSKRDTEHALMPGSVHRSHWELHLAE